MNSERLQETLYSSKFQAAVRLAVLNWLAYWANGTDEIEDETLRANTNTVIRSGMSNLDALVEKVGKLAINDDRIRALNCYHELTDDIINNAVTSVFSTKIEYLK